VRQRHQADDLAVVTQTLCADVLRRGVHCAGILPSRAVIIAPRGIGWTT
jgi:hypothetical protein